MEKIGTLAAPPAHRPVLEELARMREPSWEALVDAVSPESLKTRSGLAQAASASWDGPTGSAAGDILVDILLTLDQIRRDNQAGIDDVARAVSHAIGLEINDSERETLRRRLATLMRTRPVLLMSKTYDVATDFDFLYGSARILTDVRPIFDDEDATQSPQEATLTHTLRIDYYRNGRQQSAYYGLSPTDLADLLDVITRAIDKDHNVRNWIGALGVDLITIEGDTGADTT